MKKSKGLVGLESFKGRLRIRLPRQCFDGKQKYFSIGEDNPINRQLAEIKIRAIQSDIDLNRFDKTLESYKSCKKITIAPELPTKLTLLEIWIKYLRYLTPIRKRSTIVYLDSITKLIERSGISDINDSLGLREWLLNHTTESYVKRVLTQVNAACKWAIKNNLATSNPYLGMPQEFKHPYEQDQRPLAFSAGEKYAILEAFKNHQGNNNGRGYCGFSLNFYYGLVNFLFLTGCRPSEAIGLTWDNVEDFKIIHFIGGIQTLSNGEIYNSKGKGSKTNRFRKFPCNEELQDFLKTIYQNQHPLIFPSRKDINKPLRYRTLCDNWHKITTPIVNKESTPYNCRDTFICEQIKAGRPVAIIAKWVDSSVQTIEKYYLDIASNIDILPQ